MPKNDDWHGGDAATRRWQNDDGDLDMLAVQALGFLAADTGRLHRFVDLTGLDPSGLRQAAASPGFAMAVMTYICADEPLLVSFAAHVKRSPDAIGRRVQARTESEGWNDQSA